MFGYTTNDARNDVLRLQLELANLLAEIKRQNEEIEKLKKLLDLGPTDDEKKD